MLTGTWVEFWFAIVLWVLCLWAPIFDIDNKDELNKIQEGLDLFVEHYTSLWD